jgi:mannosyltransferase
LRDLVDRHVTAGRTVLAIAVLVGMVLRFHRLDMLSMSGDEGFAWAAASQPVSRLLQLQPMLDSGKLALHDLLLHYWIAIFGDSLRSMRGLSAAIDTVSILLMFTVVRELYRTFAGEISDSGEMAAGFAALLFATNIAIVQSGRTARMYPLMTAAELAEMLFFIRAQRRGRMSDYVLTAIFLALAIGANFTAGFILISQAFWLAYLLIAKSKKLPGATLYAAGPALSLAAGVALLLPWRRAATSLLREAIRQRDFGWIPYQPPIHWSYEVLRASVGYQWLFTLLLALAVFAIWRHRSKTLLLPMYLVGAMLGPFAGVLIASQFGVAMMVDRYVLIGVIAFLGLAAIGIASFQSRFVPIAIFGLIVWSVKLVKPPTVDWRQAAAIASAASGRNTEIGVVPVYAIDVVRYHLPRERRSIAVGLKSQCGDPHILIMSTESISRPFMAALKLCYPRLLRRDEFLEIRSR